MASDAQAPDGSLRFRGLQLVPSRYLLRFGTTELRLRPAESRLLAELLERPGWVASYDQLARVLGYDRADTAVQRAIHAHFSRLRRVVQASPGLVDGSANGAASAAFLWENLPKSGYALNTNWDGWLYLEALSRSENAQLAQAAHQAPNPDPRGAALTLAVAPEAPSSATSDAVAPSPEAPPDESPAGPSDEAIAPGAGDATMPAAEPCPEIVEASIVDVPKSRSLPRRARRPRSHRLRAVLVASGVLVLLLLGMGAGIAVELVREPSATLPDGGYTVTIQSPVAATDAGTFVPLSGKADGVPGRVRIWTFIRADGYFWPQHPAARAGDRWVGVARIGGGPADRHRLLDVLAVLANRDADQTFADWLQAGDRLGTYPPLSALPPGSRIVAATTIRVK